jgi:hypothetical protein
MEGGGELSKITLIWLVVLILVYSASYGVEPPAKPEEPATQREMLRTEEQGGPLPFPEQMVVGDVKDSKGTPLGGVTIKLFADGSLTEIAHTTATGSYEMRLPLSVDRDETVVMWFISTTEDLLPQYVVLKKSSGADRARLFSNCIIEVKMRPQMRVDATLLSESEFIASLKAKGCL